MTKKGILKVSVACILSAVTLAGTYTCFLVPELVYSSDNEIFKADKVYDDLKFYGGGEDYVKQPYSATRIKNDLVCHLDTGHNDKIIVGYCDNVTDEQIVQYNLFVDYLNKTFEIINPNYKFITQRASKDECDIFIEACSFTENFEDYDYRAFVEYDVDKFNKSIIKGGTIHMNNDHVIEEVDSRFVLAHEFYHVLTGCDDLCGGDLLQSTKYPMSIFAYAPQGHIMSAIKNSYDPNDSSFHSPFSLPMSSEIKEEWVSYMPFDLSALISIYGDSTIEENRESYLELLNSKLSQCSTLFTNENPFYYDGYSLPQVTKLPENEQEEPTLEI